MTTIDWLIIGLYFVFSFTVAIYYTKRAGKDTSEFFLSGRNLPWWIAGTAMVATTFAADTPLAVTELVAQNGIAGNWLWWNFLFGGMLTVFFFARLWRRAGVLTDVEFTEIRYSGKPAAFLRGFRAVYLGLFMNCVIMAWVNLAMVKILQVMFPDFTFFGMNELNVNLGFIQFTFSSWLLLVGVIMFLVSIYSSLSGLWGVAITDAFQFVLAMIGTIILAFIALGIPEVGGIAGLKEQLPEWALEFTPKIGGGEGQGNILALTVGAFIAYIGVQWWASWYPGSEPGGGGYVAQRMMSAKDEKHSLFATLWFIIAHYCLRPWPWIIVGLVSVVLYPNLPMAEKGDGFVMVMRDYLPAGLLGLLLASFFAAYMSTIATQLNWGTSYILNDFYRRFIQDDETEKHYVFISRIATVVLMIIAIFITSQIARISDAWSFILEASGGIGLVLILRWFWWRVNAWSEISAMIAPLVFYPFIQSYVEFPVSLFFVVGFTTVVWLFVTFLTRPTSREVLHGFYKRIHPGGVLWKPIAQELPEVKADTGYWRLLSDWVAGCVLVYSTLFGVGKLIFGVYGTAAIYLVIAAAAVAYIYYDLQKMGFEEVIT